MSVGPIPIASTATAIIVNAGFFHTIRAATAGPASTWHLFGAAYILDTRGM
jgi:hypothetical protein